LALLREFIRIFEDFSNLLCFMQSILFLTLDAKRQEQDMEITECEGYKSLLGAVERYEKQYGIHSGGYREKLDWAVNRAKHYSKVTGICACEILSGWEECRVNSFMSFYCEENQPILTAGAEYVFETTEDLMSSTGKKGYRCPKCGGVSQSAYECTSGLGKDGTPCDWKSFGQFGNIGYGTFVFVKEGMTGQTILSPIAWEIA
jgi:hypothetical protein